MPSIQNECESEHLSLMHRQWFKIWHLASALSDSGWPDLECIAIQIARPHAISRYECTYKQTAERVLMLVERTHNILNNPNLSQTAWFSIFWNPRTMSNYLERMRRTQQIVYFNLRRPIEADARYNGFSNLRPIYGDCLVLTFAVPLVRGLQNLRWEEPRKSESWISANMRGLKKVGIWIFLLSSCAWLQ